MDQHHSSFFGYRIGSQALFGEFDVGGGNHFDNPEGVGVGFATPRILIQPMDQLFDRVDTIPGDSLYVTATGCDQGVADHQQTMMLAPGKLLDHDILSLTIFDRPMIGAKDLLLFGQLDGNTALMVGVARFDYHRESDFLSSCPCILGTGDHASQRNRYSDVAQQSFGEVFIAGDRFGDRAGSIGLRSPYSALPSPLAELTQRPGSHPIIGDASLCRRLEDRSRAGAQSDIVCVIE